MSVGKQWDSWEGMGGMSGFQEVLSYKADSA